MEIFKVGQESDSTSIIHQKKCNQKQACQDCQIVILKKLRMIQNYS